MPAPSAPRRIWWYLVAASGDAKLFVLGYLVLLPFYLAPLVVTAPFFPGLDLPFHLGIADMLEKAGRPDSPYAPYYQSGLSLAPYAAHYLALLALGKVVGLVVAHELLVGLYVAGMPLAMGSLLNVLGRSRLPALLAFPLAYNLPFHYGFVSFAFSLPILLVVLAQLARLMLAPPPILWRWLAMAALAAVLFLCHLQNFLFGVCAAVAFALFSAVPWRRRLVALAAFLPAVGALVQWQLTQRPDAWNRPRGLAFAWQAVKWARLQVLPRGVPWPWWVDFKNRLALIPEHALRAFHDRSEVDAAKAIILVIGFYLLVAAAGRALLPGPRGERPRMRTATWVAFGGALAAYYLLPHHLNEFDIVTFYPRFAPLVLLMALPLISRGLRHFPVSHRAILMMPAVVLGVAWGLQLLEHYRAYARELADFRAVVAVMEPGRKLISMPFERRSRVMRVESAQLGLGSFYPLLKPAPGSMVPLMYCDMLHIPCVITKKLKEPLHDPSPWLPDQVNMDKALKFYDYFLVRSPPPRRDIFGKHKTSVELVVNKGQWFLWKRVK